MAESVHWIPAFAGMTMRSGLGYCAKGFSLEKQSIFIRKQDGLLRFTKVRLAIVSKKYVIKREEME